MQTIPNAEQTTTPSGVPVRTTVATTLIVAAMVALAITNWLPGNERATAQVPDAVRGAPPALSAAQSVPPHPGDVGHFAFGYLVFDWDPAAPGGVPGFDSWPPGSRPQ